MGHSTGGLILSLWADARRDAGLVDGLFLNSPFFDLNAPWFVRRPLAAAVARLGRRAPHRILPFSLGTVYGESLHADHRGEWTYDLAWKPLAGFPVRAGWLDAIRTGQRRLRAGLDIPVPVLLACSTRSFRGTKWQDAATLADAVLDVEHMVRWAPRLGQHVTVSRFDGGLHDLTLSGPAVREKVFVEVGRWADAFLGAGPTTTHPTPPQPRPSAERNTRRRPTPPRTPDPRRHPAATPGLTTRFTGRGPGGGTLLARYHIAPVAQRIEQGTSNPKAAGSNPAGRTATFLL